MSYSGGASDHSDVVVDGQFDDLSSITPSAAPASSITPSAAPADGHVTVYVDGQFDDATAGNDDGLVEEQQRQSQQQQKGDAVSAPFFEIQQQLPQLQHQMQQIHLNTSPYQQQQQYHVELDSSEGNSEDKGDEDDDSNNIIHATGGNTTMSRKSMESKDVLTTCLKAVQKSMLSVGSGDGSQQEALVRAGLKNLQVTFLR